ncbi:hypothetical protein [Amycolatopsis jejuensis]|uniref:hypothetical protein n=1 Tax=Amycolatopsis jejuensis TaxID=330084 RepID=UPI000AE93F78|nr:hypothetical protein [Amycolatopsis jejuensis]
MTDVFGSPFVFVVGVTTRPDENSQEMAAFDRYYTDVHLAEVLRFNSGFGPAARFEVTEPDLQVPRWLAAYGVENEQAARDFVARERPTYSPGPPAWKRAEPVWRMLWRTTAVSGQLTAPPTRLSLIGMSPPPDADAAALTAFDTYYSETHLPEIVSGFGYDRGTRLELWHEFRHPDPGCPRFCAVYEGTGARTDPPAPLTPGPPAWDKRDVRWRVKYQPLSEE